MIVKNKTNYVAEGSVTFIRSLINQHHADELDVFRRVAELCQAQADRLEGLNPDRNK